MTEDLAIVVARVGASLEALKENLNSRLDRTDQRTEKYHAENRSDMREQTRRIERLEETCGEIRDEWKATNGQVSAHRARLDEGDRNFSAVWRRLDGLARLRPERLLSKRFITVDRAVTFAAGASALAAAIKFIEWVAGR